MRSAPDDTRGASNSSPLRNASKRELPDVADVDNFGTKLVRRLVGLTFSIVGSLLVFGLLVGYLVRIDATIDVKGHLEPVAREEIRSRESAYVDTVFVNTGDTVAKGEKLLQLDTLRLSSKLTQLRAQYRALAFEVRKSDANLEVDRMEHTSSRQKAKSKLLRARANLREQLATYGYDPKANIDSILSGYTQGTHIAIDRAVADVMSAKAELTSSASQESRVALIGLERQMQTTERRSLENQIAVLEERLKRRSITAPISGVVLTDRPDNLAGQFIEKGERVLEVARLQKWQVDFFVSERKIPRISEGDHAKVEVLAFQDETKELVTGTVTSLAVEPVDSKSPPPVQGSPALDPDLYRVSVRLDPHEMKEVSRGELREGYSVEGKIVTNSGRLLTLLWEYLFTGSS